MTERSQSGAAGEQQAAHYLSAQGLTLLQRNWRCRLGEIDLVMLDRDTLVFVEVRLRHSQAFGGAAASVDARKRSKLLASAEVYLQQHPQQQQRPCRFDVVALEGSAQGKLTLNWIRNAFDR